MEKYRTIECSSAKDLWDKITPVEPSQTTKEFIYRGQGNSEWKLQSKVFREDIVQKLTRSSGHAARDHRHLERKILKEFVRCCDVGGLPIPNDSPEFRKRIDDYESYVIEFPSEIDIPLIALAQHHGAPTRLLDWTTRSYVAAYFAASSALQVANHEDSLAIWEYQTNTPERHNENFQFVRVPGSTSKNLAAQFGVFTLVTEHPHRPNSKPEEASTFDEFLSEHTESPLTKYTLPVHASRNLLALCAAHGVTAAILFPGYDGVGKAVGDFVNLYADYFSR